MSTMMEKGRNLGTTAWLALLGLSVVIFGRNTGVRDVPRQPAGRRQRRGGEPAGVVAAARQPGP
jgi:hypothetical protein